jgi:phage tail-like protein
MAGIIAQEFLDYLYDRLPYMYKLKDEKKELYKYLGALVMHGFAYNITDLENLLTLVDMDTCPSKFLPLLCDNFGVEFLANIPETFVRKLLKNVVELYRRKGTKSGMEYLARELSGFRVDISEDAQGNITLYVIKLRGFEDESSDLLLSQDAVTKVVEYFTPVLAKISVIVSYDFSDSSNLITASLEEMWDSIKETFDDTFNSGNLVNDDTENTSIVETGTEEVNQNFKLIDPDGSYTNDYYSKLNSTFRTNGMNTLDIIRVNGTIVEIRA